MVAWREKEREEDSGKERAHVNNHICNTQRESTVVLNIEFWRRGGEC